MINILNNIVTIDFNKIRSILDDALCYNLSKRLEIVNNIVELCQKMLYVVNENEAKRLVVQMMKLSESLSRFREECGTKIDSLFEDCLEIIGESCCNYYEETKNIIVDLHYHLPYSIFSKLKYDDLLDLTKRIHKKIQTV